MPNPDNIDSYNKSEVTRVGTCRCIALYQAYSEGTAAALATTSSERCINDAILIIDMSHLETDHDFGP